MKILVVDHSPLWVNMLRTVAGCLHPHVEVLQVSDENALGEILNYQEVNWLFYNASYTLARPSLFGYISALAKMQKMALVTVCDKNHPFAVNRSLDVDCKGFISFSDTLDMISSLVKNLMYNKGFVSPNLRKMHQTISQFKSGVGAELTEQELQIFKLVCATKGNSEIAEELAISPDTVKKHRQNINAKLGTKSGLCYLHFGIKMGIVCPIEITGGRKDEH